METTKAKGIMIKETSPIAVRLSKLSQKDLLARYDCATNKLTQKDLMARWGCTLRTVQREVRKYGLMPADFTGRQPLFTEKAVKRMEARRVATRCKDNGIITVKEAKRLAGEGK